VLEGIGIRSGIRQNAKFLGVLVAEDQLVAQTRRLGRFALEWSAADATTAVISAESKRQQADGVGQDS